MKTLWNVLAIVSFLNLVVALALVGWLVNSGRLDASRVRSVRAMFSETVAAERERLDAEAEASQVDEHGVRLPDRPPLTAEDQLRARVLESEADQLRLRRLEREVQNLRATLDRERELVDDQRAALEAERAEFRASRQAIAETEGAEQFRRALVVLEKIAPKQAMQTLSSLLEAGQRDVVVGYLNAMSDGVRSDVLTEFVKDGRAELAGELLEELRTRGVGDALAEARSP